MLVTVMLTLAGLAVVGPAATPAGAAADPAGFCDVAGAAFSRDAVVWGRETGVVSGITEIRFSPDAATSRAEIVTMLHRFVTWENGGTPPPAGEPVDFGDVPDGAFFADAVRWAVGAGVTYGTSDTTFSPGDPTTREQLAALIHRLRGGPPDHPVTDDFSDLGRSSFPREISWMYDEGITTGTSPATFSPERVLTRGEIVTFLWRLAGSPAPADAPAPECRFLMVGDSVMLGVALYDGLQEDGRFPGWSGVVDAIPCRQPVRGLACPTITYTSDVIDAAVAGDYLGDLVVIHAGNNDSTFGAADFDALVDAADGADEIWFMNLRSTTYNDFRPWIADVNAEIAAGVQRWSHTGRVFLLDWWTASGEPGVLVDGTHVTNPHGARVYSDLLATALS